ncbi:MAG: cupin domain-containing protein [Pirellulales bacterium]
MKRTWPALVAGAALGAAGMAFAHAHHHDAHDGESVRPLARYELREKLDDQPAAASVVEVTIEPGQAGLPHRHPGPAIVYVLEGEYELGIDDQPTKIFKAGETFCEPAGCLHRVSKNPGKTEKTRLIAVVLHAQEAKEIATPEAAAH